MRRAFKPIAAEADDHHKRLAGKPAECHAVQVARRKGSKMSEAIENVNGKAKKKQAGKASTRQGGSRVKATIHLSIEADRKLSIHAAMSGSDRSAIIEKLINDHLKRWVVSDRGGAGEEAGGEAA